MITKEGLEIKYSAMSNDELLEIMDNKHSYTDLAISVALAEISKRNISENEITRYKEKQLAGFEREIKKNFIDDLKVYQKLLFYLFWLPLFTFAFKINYARDGYVLKRKQASFYSWCGFIVFVVAVLLEDFINLSDLNSCIFIILCFPGVLYYDHTVRKQKLYEKFSALFGVKENQDNQEAETEN